MENEQRYCYPRNRYYYYAGKANAGLVPGLILVGIGALVFLNNLHIVYLREWLQYWPVILIAVGVVKLVDSNEIPGRAGGGILIVVGAILLARNLGFVDMRVRDMWPLILIAVGLYLLFQRTLDWPQAMGNWWQWGDQVSDANSLHADAVFGGGKRVIVTQDFKGGHVSAVFGGFELDLRRAGMQNNSAVLKIDAVFGGVELKIPQTWAVDVRGAGVFGAYTDNTIHPDDSHPETKRLILTGGAVFGGVDIKN